MLFKPHDLCLLLLSGLMINQAAHAMRDAEAGKAGVEVDVEQVQEFFRSRDDLDFDPVYISDLSSDTKLFTDYSLLLVAGPMMHDQMAYLAIAPDKTLFKLPDDIGAMLAHEDAELVDQARIEDIVRFYLRFDVVVPADRHLLLSAISDIPTGDAKIEFSDIDHIAPLQIETREDGWEVEFYSWRMVMGPVFHWRISMTPENRFAVREKRELARGVGAYQRFE